VVAGKIPGIALLDPRTNVAVELIMDVAIDRQRARRGRKAFQVGAKIRKDDAGRAGPPTRENHAVQQPEPTRGSFDIFRQPAAAGLPEPDHWPDRREGIAVEQADWPADRQTTTSSGSSSPMAGASRPSSQNSSNMSRSSAVTAATSRRGVIRFRPSS
jgi:hypothetical protein